jgi:tetratricopeptide (TPR) repeat protein
MMSYRKAGFGILAASACVAFAPNAIAANLSPEVSAQITSCFSPADTAALPAAIDACTKLLAHPEFDAVHRSRIYLSRAAAYAGTGAGEKAVADFNKSIQLNPGEPHAYYNRGAYWMDHNNLVAAKADFKKAAQIDGTLTVAYLKIGAIDEQTGDFAGALEAFSQAIKNDPTDAKAFLGRSAANAKLGHGDAAIADIRSAVRLDPSLAGSVRINGKPVH